MITTLWPCYSVLPCSGEEPGHDQYSYLPNEEMLKIPDDSMMTHDMDTTEKKNSTMSRAGDDHYNDTIERTILNLEKQKDRVDYGRNYDSMMSDNIALSAPPVNAG